MAALAAPAALPAAPFAAPCLTAGPDVAAFQAAFQTAGWAEAKSPADWYRVASTLSQIDYMMLVVPDAPQNAADSARIATDAAAWIAPTIDNYLYFSRGEMMARLHYLVLDANVYVTCLFSAPEIPKVMASFGPDTPGYNGIQSIAVEPPPLPPGVIEITMGAVRINTPYMSDEVRSARDTLYVTLLLPPQS